MTFLCKSKNLYEEEKFDESRMSRMSTEWVTPTTNFEAGISNYFYLLFIAGYQNLFQYEAAGKLFPCFFFASIK